MAFRTAFIAHAPDADPAQHNCVIETGKSHLSVYLVSSQEQALEVSAKLAGEGVHAISLCPGFTTADVAAISAAAGSGVGVSVARGDGPSGRIAAEAIAREWG